MSTKKNFVTVEGVVTIAYPNGMFLVHLDNDIDVLTVVSDTWGQAVSWSSVGACGFKGTKRRSPFAAQTAAANVVDTLVNQGLLKEAEVMISGPGSGRDTAL
ncbi:small ribosomal subunit protein uS11c-like [Cryptomeria japonica]|uniref:small ribosomal subunit protein uS11c-like n=1 Tax=Cryptomeria japonica TaxID=3369 RepID=UPI0027DA9BFB|nr:small ribosomal subunit protein uS11c-like [Cryptomeria japonica]